MFVADGAQELINSGLFRIPNDISIFDTNQLRSEPLPIGTQEDSDLRALYVNTPKEVLGGLHFDI
jgi:hypothetical protein